MLTKKDGVIINIVSVAGPALTARRYVRSVEVRAGALGIGPRKDSGIRVCNIYPGEVVRRFSCFVPISETSIEDLASGRWQTRCYSWRRYRRMSVPELVTADAQRMFRLAFV